MKKVINRSTVPIRVRYKGEGCIIHPKQIIENIDPKDFSPYRAGEKLPFEIYFV